MSEQTLAATEAVIDAQAEAAKAVANLEETQRKEIEPVVAAVVETIEAEEEGEEQWEDRVSALLMEVRTELQAIRESLTESNKQLASQLLTSMTEVFQTAVATIAVTQSNPPVSPITEIPAESEPESPVVIEAPAEVVEVEKPKARTRKI